MDDTGTPIGAKYNFFLCCHCAQQQPVFSDLDKWLKFKTHLRYNISYSYKRRAFNLHILDREEHMQWLHVDFETAVAHGW